MTVQIAEFAGGYLGCVNGKESLGRVAGLEELCIASAVGQQLNPFNPVLFFHGVRHAAHFHQIAAVNLFNDGNVLFHGAVSGTLNHQLHGLATADDVGAAAMQNFNNITTVGALINFQMLGHGFLTDV